MTTQLPEQSRHTGPLPTGIDEVNVSYEQSNNHGVQIGFNSGTINNHFFRTEETEDRATQHNNQLLAILSSEAYALNLTEYQRRIEDMVISTGSWLWEEASYKRWASHEESLLRVLAGPGTGKSFLAAAMIKRVKDMAHENMSVAFFFVNGRDDRLQRVKEILKTMAFDIQRFNHTFRDYLLQILTQSVELYTVKQSWKRLFDEFWTADLVHGRLLLIIDGLDEAPEEEQKAFSEILRHHSNPAIQFAIFGRTTLENSLNLSRRRGLISLSAKGASKDLTEYVKRSMNEDTAFQLVTAAKRGEWETKIVQKTHGVFESARQVVQNIRGKESFDIDEFLEQPLDSLDKNIKISLDIITKHQAIKPTALKILLTWLSYSRRPLSLVEVYEILRAQDGHTHEQLRVNLQSRFRPIIECTGFGFDFARRRTDLAGTSVERPPHEWTERELSSTIVTLGHEGIRDYLRSRAESGDDLIHLPEFAECELVKSCIRLYKQPKDPTLQGPTPYQLEYPAIFLTTHLQSIEPSKLASSDVEEIRNGLTWLLWTSAGNEAFLEAAAATAARYELWQAWFTDQSKTALLQRWVTVAGPIARGLRSSRRISDHKILLALIQWFGGALLTFLLNLLPRSSQCRALPSIHSHDSNRSSFNEIDRWRHRADHSVFSLFQPLRASAVRRWLTSTPTESIGREGMISLGRMASSITVLQTLTYMDESGSVPASCGTLSYDIHIEAKEIQRLARVYRLSEDNIWLTNLAISLQIGRYYHESVPLYHQVIGQDPTSFIAVWRLAQCYAGLNDYDNAYWWTQELRKLRPPPNPQYDEMVAILLSLRGEDEQLLEQFKDDYMEDKEDGERQMRYLSLLDKLGKYHEIAIALLDLATMDVPDREYDQMTRLMGNQPSCFWTWAGKSYAVQKGTKEADQMLAVIDQCMRYIRVVGDQFGQLLHEAAFNDFLYERADMSIAKAIEINEDLFRKASSLEQHIAAGHPNQMAVKVKLSNVLAQLYFDQIMFHDHESSADSLRLSRQRFKDIADTNDSMIQNQQFNIYPPRPLLYPKFLYARWLRLTKSDGEDEWKAIFRDCLRNYLPSLASVPLIGNFDRIGIVVNLLLHAGDQPRALALVQLVTKASSTEALLHRPSRLPFPNEVNADTQVAPALITSPSEDTTNNTSSRLLPSASTAHGNRKSQTTATSNVANLNHSSSGSRSSITVVNSPFLNCTGCGRASREFLELYTCDICLDVSYCNMCAERRSLIYGAACPDEHAKLRLWTVDGSITDIEPLEDYDMDGFLRIKLTWLEELKSEWQI